MESYRDLEFKSGNLKDINTGNFISIYSNNTIASDIERDELPASDGDSIITLHDMNINIYDEYSNRWKKLFGNRGFGSDPYSPRATGIFAISNTCYSINIESCHIEQFSGMFINSKLWAGSCSNGVNNRGIFCGSNSVTNSIEYMNISACNITYDFGDLSFEQVAGAALSNGVNNRGVFTGGVTTLKSMCYITISSTGNALNFGELSHINRYHTCTSNATGNRGLIIGTKPDILSPIYLGRPIDLNSYPTYRPSYCSRIDYISISTTGNSNIFGYLCTISGNSGSGTNGELGRTIIVGGNAWIDIYMFQHWWDYRNDTFVSHDKIDYLSITTLQNSATFANLLSAQTNVSCVSNGVRNRLIIYGDNGTITSGSVLSFLHNLGISELVGNLTIRYDNRMGSISNA